MKATKATTHSVLQSLRQKFSWAVALVIESIMWGALVYWFYASSIKRVRSFFDKARQIYFRLTSDTEMMMSMTTRPTKSFEGSKTAHNPTWWHALLIGNNVLVHNASPKSGRAIYWYQSELDGQITPSY